MTVLELAQESADAAFNGLLLVVVDGDPVAHEVTEIAFHVVVPCADGTWRRTRPTEGPDPRERTAVVLRVKS